MDPKLRFCYSCLTDDDESVQCYIGKGSLQTIMGSIIPLCRYCMEVAENAEKFIANIECNQLLTERLKITAEIIKKHKIQYQENLYVFTPKVGESQTQTIGKVLEIEPKSLCDNDEVKVKDEENEEVNFNNESVEDDFGNDSDMLKKEDDEDYSIMKLKTELELLGVKIKKVKEEKPEGIKRQAKTHFTRQTKKKKIIEEIPPCVSNAVDGNVGDENKIKGRKKKFTAVKSVRLTSEQIKEVIEERVKNAKYTNSLFKCTNCTKGYNVQEKFDKHMEKHDTKTGSHICQYCTQRFQYKELLLKHLHCHTKRFKCVVCGKMGTSWLEMTDHYEINHNTSNDQSSDTPYQCDKCPKSFTGRRGLYSHTRDIHKDHTRVTCQICQKTFKNKLRLQNHMIVHTDKAPKNVCDQCGKAFPSQQCLKSHLIKHSTNKDYYCVECDKSFKSQGSLNTHLKITRAHISSFSVLKYACDNCEKRFKDKTVLTRHINSEHLKIRPYKCDQCASTYTNPWSLKHHIKLTHSLEDVRIFQCTMCEKSFKLKGILKDHIRTHTAEKPYQCSECPASFTQSSSLGTHYRLIHLKLNRNGKPKDGGSRNIKISCLESD